jgi:hypothetical protein
MDLNEIRLLGVGWICLTWGVDQCLALVNIVMNIWFHKR